MRDPNDHGAGEQGLARVRCANRVHDLIDRAILGQVAVRAGLDRLEHSLVVVESREHHHASRRPARLDRPGRLRARAVRQAVVHQHDVHAVAGHGLCLRDAAGDADDPQVGLKAHHL